MDNDLIPQKLLSLCQKIQKKIHEKPIINDRIIVKLYTGVAHNKPILHTKQSSEKFYRHHR